MRAAAVLLLRFCCHYYGRLPPGLLLPIGSPPSPSPRYNLECAVQSYGEQVAEVYVIQGPIYSTTVENCLEPYLISVPCADSTDGIRIPEGYFKVVIEPQSDGSVKSWVFVMTKAQSMTPTQPPFSGVPCETVADSFQPGKTGFTDLEASSQLTWPSAVKAGVQSDCSMFGC